MPHLYSEDDDDSNKDDENNINNKYNGDSDGDGEEASQPDTQPEDVALPPARVARGNTSSMYVILLFFSHQLLY